MLRSALAPVNGEPAKGAKNAAAASALISHQFNRRRIFADLNNAAAAKTDANWWTNDNNGQQSANTSKQPMYHGTELFDFDTVRFRCGTVRYGCDTVWYC